MKRANDAKTEAKDVPGRQQIAPKETELTPREAKYSKPSVDGDEGGVVRSPLAATLPPIPPLGKAGGHVAPEVELTSVRTEKPTEKETKEEFIAT